VCEGLHDLLELRNGHFCSRGNILLVRFLGVLLMVRRSWSPSVSWSLLWGRESTAWQLASPGKYRRLQGVAASFAAVERWLLNGIPWSIAVIYIYIYIWLRNLPNSENLAAARGMSPPRNTPVAVRLLYSMYLALASSALRTGALSELTSAKRRCARTSSSRIVLVMRSGRFRSMPGPTTFLGLGKHVSRRLSARCCCRVRAACLFSFGGSGGVGAGAGGSSLTTLTKTTCDLVP